jgi:putative (di)nucleoside polyphosphate hydrolase
MNDKNHNIEDLKMRKAVGIILIRDDGFVWTGKRKISPGVRDGEKNLWQMPQGGIDEGEKKQAQGQPKCYLNLKIGSNIGFQMS